MTPDSDTASRTPSSDPARVRRPGALVVSAGEVDTGLVTLLERGGYAVVTARLDLVLAIQALAVPPDIIAVDLRHIDAASLAICARLRAVAGRRPLMVLVERAAATDIVAALAVGADDCLVKPIAGEELLARLDALRRRGDWRGRSRHDLDGARGMEASLGAPPGDQAPARRALPSW